MWKRSFLARRPSKTKSWRCENEALVRDIPKKLVEDVKTKLSRETSHKLWKVEDVKAKLSFPWERSFRARLPYLPFKFWSSMQNDAWSGSSTEGPIGRSDHDPGTAETASQSARSKPSPSIFRDTFCPAKHRIPGTRYLSKLHFMRDLPQKVKVEDVKTKLSCKEVLQQRDYQQQRLDSKEVPQQGDLAAQRFHSKETQQQRNLTAKKSHSKETSQQRNLTAKRSHSKEVSQQRDLTARKSHRKEISQRRDLLEKKPHSKEVSQKDLTAKKCHSKEIS